MKKFEDEYLKMNGNKRLEFSGQYAPNRSDPYCWFYLRPRIRTVPTDEVEEKKKLSDIRYHLLTLHTYTAHLLCPHNALVFHLKLISGFQACFFILWPPDSRNAMYCLLSVLLLKNS